ncbi:hypothetical protein Lal_00038225 [Lupinus albus]|nr:hypothetical protein Lal_00038225 [Lupinus albus]
MSHTVEAILGGALGSLALFGIIMLLLWFFLFKQRCVSMTLENGLSIPSQVEPVGRIGLLLPETRRFKIEELSLATQNFNMKNLIGEGKLGKVYKGLLQDGVPVAIKKRHRIPSQEFIDEVRYLSSIQHQNLVTLLGYCQENNLQFIVYEYVTNGCVFTHFYGAGEKTHEKIEFKHLLKISLGAAKGLAHLHSLSPCLLHKNFKTTNVLVDENFIAKVADAGIHNFLGKFEIAGSSSHVASEQIFLAPEVRKSRRFSEKSDVYSYGIFLLELLSGKKASKSLFLGSNQNLVEWVQSIEHFHTMFNIIDQRLGSSFTFEGMVDFILLVVRCLYPLIYTRPTMSYVVMELDRILEKEINVTKIMDEGTLTVILGSQLFKETTNKISSP